MTEFMETLSVLALLVIVIGSMASMGLSLKMKQIIGPLRDMRSVFPLLSIPDKRLYPDHQPAS